MRFSSDRSSLTIMYKDFQERDVLFKYLKSQMNGTEHWSENIRLKRVTLSYPHNYSVRSIQDGIEIMKLRERVDQLEFIVCDIWTTFYGEGLEVANYHLNGDLEPMDEFFHSSDWSIDGLRIESEETAVACAEQVAGCLTRDGDG
ncbi:hypothetical protein [Gimesia fumaroli]|uniref:Uncharacterized protein n=1 Tax=Gimesia fumaroli TaxID=2527976 RepID=A0A518I907_9PLAN|nr:hypothetical protein [Gimesia fumaroli]QDV49598.1 hypothetical protein Enr17x_16180 [Gimesia fumaroli]